MWFFHTLQTILNELKFFLENKSKIILISFKIRNKQGLKITIAFQSDVKKLENIFLRRKKPRKSNWEYNKIINSKLSVQYCCF